MARVYIAFRSKKQHAKVQLHKFPSMTADSLFWSFLGFGISHDFFFTVSVEKLNYLMVIKLTNFAPSPFLSQCQVSWYSAQAKCQRSDSKMWWKAGTWSLFQTIASVFDRPHRPFSLAYLSTTDPNLITVICLRKSTPFLFRIFTVKPLCPNTLSV